MAQLDFGLLNTNAPAQIAGAYGAGQQEARANLLAEQQLQHAQNQNALSKYQIDAARMQNEGQNALNAKYASGGFDPMANDTHLKQLYGMGTVGRAQAGEILKYRADQRKEEESAFNMASKRHEVYKQEMGALATEPNLTKDAVAATLDKLVTGGLFSQTARDTIIQNLPNDPAALRASIMQDAKANLKGKDQLTAFLPELMVAGGNVINKNPLAPGGAGAVVAPVAMTGFEAARVPILQQQANAATANANIAGQRLGLEGQRVDLAKQAQITEGLNPKEIQKREAALPQATAAIKGFETKSDSFVKDLEKLRDHPGLSEITGIAAGRLPGITANGRAAQALYDKVVAKGGFQALQDMRDASKTGGALGNISNQEGKQLTASFAAINRVQDANDVRAAIDEAVANIQSAKTRMREAYDSTYSYKSNVPAATAGAWKDL